MATTMLIEMFDALKAAGAPDDQARKAATAVLAVTGEPRLAKIEDRIAKIEGRVTRIETELVLHRWLFGVMIAMQLATFGGIITMLTKMVK